MVSKCANPDCNTRFRYLRSGKLFQFDVPTGDSGAKKDGAGAARQNSKKPVHKIEHFWLCGECAASMTLRHEKNRGVIVIPIRKYHRATA